MANGNTVTVVGNLTRDPELRYTPSGASNVRFGVAVNRRWMDRNTNEWQEATSFFDVVCWREMAENVSESLAKGARVVVTGRLEQRSYEDRDGNRRNVVEIIADEVGPSLRFATAEITKNDRRGGADFGGDPGGARAGRGGEAAQPAATPGGGGGDNFGEEPF
jgi:single-strand DNA-binding protein